MKKISKTRTLDTPNELRLRLRLKLKCNENTHFYHEDAPKEEQFITATHFVDKDIIEVGIFLNKVEKELGMAIKGDMSKDTNELVKTCEEIARKAHNGQIRKFGDDKGKPYIVHPERVASKFDDPYLICVGWLHDTIEDTDMDEWTLVGLGLPWEVINAVKALTKQEGENYFDFILRIKEDPIARPVKIADIEDNMVSLKEGSLKDKYRFALHVLKEY